MLRAKIDMASPNVTDARPHALSHSPSAASSHRRHGDLSDVRLHTLYIRHHKGITHSLCTLEFENNRPLYEWVLNTLGLPTPHPQQIEFARLGLEQTNLSKRNLLRLVEGGEVTGWDDPRMPTISGLRRRVTRPKRFADSVNISAWPNAIAR